MQFYVLDTVARLVTPVTGDYFKVKFSHVDGTEELTDKIENVMYGKLTKAAALAVPFTAAHIKLDAAVNGGAPVSGETYTIKVSYPEVGGLGNEGWVTKTASVLATSKVADAATLYTELAKALNDAFGVDAVLEATSGAEGVSVTQKDLTKYYKRGVRPLVMPQFTVTASVITLDGEEVMPFDATSFNVVESDVNPIKNGYKVADMEYFAMGERGDQYRYADYINAIETEYRINPKGEYDVLTVHFAYKGANQNSHKSEKDLIVVAPTYKAEELKTLATSIEAACKVDFTVVETLGGNESALA
jgi:hypothetical protein